ncbi:MAG: 1-deoxy-D-xylulose-5-phosphate reductoisomerase [Phycisphaerae bacterium]|nr:1-deoxy-D-xylulose-5-phosphate reductoisomerase [Phycisphaerae bacterium]MDW8261348.1 1-deoxy-D-xylulose-5-phosphate reductoisomerase [Phycisphaerales bacterium]
MPKRVAILGSTGSIGVSALDVIARHPDRLCVSALSAFRRVEELIAQCDRFRPSAVAVGDETILPQLRGRIQAELYCGPRGLAEIVTRADVDVVVAAIVGAAGLPAVLSAVQAGKQLALANKEALVVAGSLLMPEARKRGAQILPVDSEHSAVFQAMQAGRLSEVRRVLLTASGGPFRGWSSERMREATVEDALNHPTWRMGTKITIDSATMFNKALEIIEAVWLFDLPPEKIEVVIHPESIVHSMVEFVDGSVIAQLSPPDMRTPIQYALTYPDRIDGTASRIEFNTPCSLHFEPPDLQRFPALRLGYEAARIRGTMGAVLNAANEIAVEAFTTGKIPFGRIAPVVEATMQKHAVQPSPSLDDLLEADRWARRTAAALINL